MLLRAREVVQALSETTHPRVRAGALSRWRFLMAERTLGRAFPTARRRELHWAIEQAVSELE